MGSPNNLRRRLPWGIKPWQLLAFASFYIFFGFQYWLVIWYTGLQNQDIWERVLLDYTLKFALTIPLWWLYFIFWKNKSLVFKITMHLVTCPLWIYIWLVSYRAIQDMRGAYYLVGDGMWWDVYIPFLVYSVQFSVFHVYDYYLQTQNQKQKEKELLRLAYNSEVTALKAQIQPHFLFNTLNSISASVPKEMEHTRELIAKLADTFRYCLLASEKEWISLEEELNFTKVTLELEKERLKKRLEVVFDIDTSLLQTPVPPMLLQPITENAIKHGIAPKIEGGCITISVTKRQNKVHISVSDTGVGYNKDLNDSLFNKGIGLRNTTQRLEKLFGEKMTVTKNEPCGLNFSFSIPLQHARTN